MSHEELCKLNNEVDRQATEEKRRYRTLRENAERQHDDAVRTENDRYTLECRKLRLEHESRMDEIISRKDKLRVEFAKNKDKEEE